MVFVPDLIHGFFVLFCFVCLFFGVFFFGGGGGLVAVNLFVVCNYFFRPCRSKNCIVTAALRTKLSQ